MNSNFSLEEKIGQMILTGFHGKHVDENSLIVKDILVHHLGNLWITDKDDLINSNVRNIESPQQLKKLTTDLQNFSKNKLFIAIDAEGGKVIRLKEEYGFPKTLSAKFLGDKNDLSLTKENSILIAQTLKEAGININFAPVVDLNINKDLNVIGKKERSFSDNPEIVFQHAKEFILAHKEKNIATCIKHFPGHGSAISDTHDGFVDSTKYWNEKELIPYKLLIEENLADAIMISHVYNKHLDEQYPSSLSKRIINDLLREKLSFNGLIFTDDLDMKAINDNYSLEKSLELAINAGVDIIIKSNIKNPVPDLVEKMIKAIKKLIEKNIITERRIDESFERIILLKKKLGLINSQ
jgi:beta-N-acetylhexosaminidase